MIKILNPKPSSVKGDLERSAFELENSLSLIPVNRMSAAGITYMSSSLQLTFPISKTRD